MVGRDDDDEEKADLAARVKQLQRDSEEGKQQWWAFCDAEGFSNRRDPNRHSSEFLRRFFDARRDGRIPAGRVIAAPAHEADPEMHKIWVGRIKQAQRSSPEQKQKWERYCDIHGGGVRDPQRHDSNYLRRFFEEFLNGDEGGCGGAGQMAWGGGGGGAMQGYPGMGGYPQMGGFPMGGYPQMGGYSPMGYPPMGNFPSSGTPPGGSGTGSAGGPEGYQQLAGYPGMPGYPQMPPMMGGMAAYGYPWMMGGAGGGGAYTNPTAENGRRGAKSRSRSRSRSRRRRKRSSSNSSL